MSVYRFAKPNRPVNRVFIHCSASDNPAHDNVATIDAWHKANGWAGIGYHIFIRKDGRVEMGRSLSKTPAAQRGHNRGTIAICLHGLEKDRFTEAQIRALFDICCDIRIAYGGRVTFHGHREVANKACPVFDYQSVLDLDEAGNMGSDIVSVSDPLLVEHPDLHELENAEAGEAMQVSLRNGDKSLFVTHLQETLLGLGYHVGEVDGHFGSLTRAAVMAFQADNHLVEDGIAGPATFEALEDAEARTLSEKRKHKTVIQLADGGSRIAQASLVQGAAGTALTAGGAVSVLEESTGVVTRIAESVGLLEDVFGEFGPLFGALVIVAGLLVVIQAMKAGKARRDDHRSGKTL